MHVCSGVTARLASGSLVPYGTYHKRIESPTLSNTMSSKNIRKKRKYVRNFMVYTLE